MEYKLLKNDKGKMEFEVAIAASETEEKKREAYQKNKQKYALQGFRKGKAPMHMIERFYGENVFLEYAINVIFSDAYDKILAEREIETIDQPDIDAEDFDPKKDSKLKLTIYGMPEIEAKDYAGLEAKLVEHKPGKADIDRELEALRERGARQVSVAREAKKDDTAVIDFKGSIDGEYFEGGAGNDYPLVLGSGSFIPGFEDQIIGKKAGDEFVVETKFPDDYGAKDIAGKDAKFEVTLKEVKEKELPALDDEFVSDATEFETLKDFKDDIKKRLTESGKTRAEAEMKDEILAKVYEVNKPAVPEKMLRDTQEDMADEVEAMLKQQGMDVEKYYQAVGKDRKEVVDSFKGDAEKKAGLRIILTSIARQEKISADESDVDAEIKKIADAYRIPKEKLLKDLPVHRMIAMKNEIKLKKTVDFLFESAIVKETAKEDDRKDDGKEKEAKE